MVSGKVSVNGVTFSSYVILPWVWNNSGAMYSSVPLRLWSPEGVENWEMP